MLVFNGGEGGGIVVSNGVAVGGGGGRWDFKNVMLYVNLEPFTKARGYHATMLST